jgi:drug/metabolite transporter (DMT)-like permease
MSRRGWVLFVALGLIWGIPYLLIKVAVAELAPSTLVLLRCSLAAAALLPIALARGQVRPLLPRWRPLLAFAFVEICLPWLLLGYAERRLSSSLTGLLIASVPMIGALLARVGGDHEPLGTRRLAGLLTGFVGVLSLVGFELGAGDLPGIAALAVVATCYAVGPMILARWLSDAPGIAVIALSLTAAAVGYLPAGLAQAPRHLPGTDVVLAALGLAAICTALAFLVFFALIHEVGPARSTVITYVNPAVAVLLGVLVLGEPFTRTIALGFALILTGSVLATSRSREPRPTPGVLDDTLTEGGDTARAPFPARSTRAQAPPG